MMVGAVDLNDTERRLIEAFRKAPGRYLTVEEISELSDNLHHNTIHARMFYLRGKGFDFGKETRRNASTGKPYYAYNLSVVPEPIVAETPVKVVKKIITKNLPGCCPSCGADAFFSTQRRDGTRICDECGTMLPRR